MAPTHFIPPTAITNGTEKLAAVQVTAVKAMDSDSDFDPQSSSASVMASDLNHPVSSAYTDSSRLFDADDDPACIVGIGCRLPGDIRSPSQLWDLITEKKSTQGPVPPGRFNINGFYHPDNTRSGCLNANGGYFLNEDVRKFENTFFDINNLEAIYMDPQQRKLLEVVYECLEDSGVPDISGTNTGVFVGNFTIDFQTMMTRDPDYIHRYSATGSGSAIMANRISHVFNLNGPSFTLDTACSSSVYSLHNAVIALKNGDCQGAIVAGANLVTSPEQHIGTAKGGVLSATSTSHTFDSAADGYGRAEAVNAIYIKRLSAALKDGDRIRAVIRSTAVNANGRTNGITLPSSDFQEKVIRSAYAKAGLRFADTDYVECHGTGTAVGDPIEVAALARCFAPRHTLPLLIGAVKPNLGHSEAASGLSGIIKVVLAFEKGLIPPTHGIDKLNPKLQLESNNIQVVTELREWPRAVRRASINSFGFGGANAHAILESIESYLPGYDAERTSVSGQICKPKLNVIPLSAATQRSLEEKGAHISSMLSRGLDQDAVDGMGFTLAHKRKSLEKRAFLLARPHQDGVEMPSLTTSSDAGNGALPVAFVFTGQGAQYPGLARELVEQSPIFEQVIQDLDGHLQRLPKDLAPDWSLRQTLLDPAGQSQIHDVTRSQPICTAIQIALVDMLGTWGIKPTATVGHSSGEIGAAYAAGLLTAKQAIMVAYLRGYAVGQLKCKGSMAAASLTVEAAKDLIRQNELGDEVSVACVNAPESVTLSGSTKGIDMLCQQLGEKRIFARKLETGGRAYHSFMMKEIGSLYESVLAPHLREQTLGDSREPQAAMYSSVGTSSHQRRVLGRHTKLRERYWRDNLENSVQFNSALEALIGDKAKGVQLIELGPHSALKGPVEQIRAHLGLSHEQAPYSATLVRNKDADVCIKTLAGTLYNQGHALDFSAVNGWSSGRKPVHDLPPYPWDYSNGLLWSEPRASIELRQRKHLWHELLGSEQLAHDGTSHSWRCLLQLDQAAWLRDHKLETQTVFPAAGYLGMAMEAVSRVQGVQAEELGVVYEFRDVNITKALVLPDGQEIGQEIVEMHTTLMHKRLSTSVSSAKWYDFTISSWLSGKGVTHCAGSIRVQVTDDALTQVERGALTVAGAEHYDEWSMSRWYERLTEHGLCFGPDFQTLSSMKTDSNRVKSNGISVTNLVQRHAKANRDSQEGTFYTLHPLTIDACLQAAIMASTGGDISKLRALLPVYIPECRIRRPEPSTVGRPAFIHTKSTTTGPTTKHIDSTLRDALGNAVMHMGNVHVSLYSGLASHGSGNGAQQRHPCLRVDWRPDILRLDADSQPALSRWMTEWKERNMPGASQDDASAAALLDLQSYKNPKMRVLELGDECDADRICRVLGGESAFPRYQSWVRGEIDEAGNLQTAEEAKGPWQAIVIKGKEASDKLCSMLSESSNLVDKHGIVVCSQSALTTKRLVESGFTVVETAQGLVLAIRNKTDASFAEKQAIILVHNPSAQLMRFIKGLQRFLLSKLGMAQAQVVSLKETAHVTTSRQSVCISLLEVEKALLASMSSAEMDALRRITATVADIVWLTGSGLLNGDLDPDKTLVHGMSRAVMMEQPSLRLSILDVGKAMFSSSSERLTCANIAKVLVSQHDMDDKEFVQTRGLLYVSRFVPQAELNASFCRRLAADGTQPPSTAELGQAAPARLGIQRAGVMDTLSFQEMREPQTEVPAGFIDVSVKAIALNATNVYTFSGQAETSNGATANEFGGVVERIGAGVSHLAAGDRVVVMAPDYFGTHVRVPAWAAQRLLPSEDFATMVSLPVAHVQAMYALHDRAKLQPGETILIHAGAEAFGAAAIQLAHKVGAIVYTTVSTQAKRDHVARLGVAESRIFQSSNGSFAQDVHKATQGRGLDVIINSLEGDLLHDGWRCIANFGRFVEVGQSSLVDAGRLDMGLFMRNTTFTAFDLNSLFFDDEHGQRSVLIKHFERVLDMYRSGGIEASPVTSFEAGDVAAAFRYFWQGDVVGKIVVKMEDARSLVPVTPARYSTCFSPDKSYLLVGCLGGLGRSLSRWMLARGARKFVFLGRSGCDKPDAQRLVSGIKTFAADVRVTVVRGDVCSADDVTRAVEAACQAGPLGGVVQAAMGLHEGLFDRMSSEAWHKAVRPKWAGTWNLHGALQAGGHDASLDFFLLTSSVSGSVGTATESNYCAANGFLDAFAQWRRQQGKRGVSVGLGMISEVGYLHENPDIEALLLRKGIQPLKEDEFLQVLDLAIAQDKAFCPGQDEEDKGKAHILTGLEPFGLRDLLARGFQVDNGTLQDPRASLLAATLTAHQAGSEGGDSGALSTAVQAPWLTARLAAGPAGQALAAQGCAGTLHEAVLQMVVKRFSSLVLLAPEQINSHKALAGFGMDSMIAAEFRMWFWGVFRVDVAFLDLLSEFKSLEDLVGVVVAGLEGEGEGVEKRG
ncbi:hypothetical protein CDD81_7707 [Ophiocordyceps australis]|uniref:Uncharacterized protein n=1 Tax=Ophiocordyceps australis TaxID=1399860 RepID=A0A2C5XGP0_9HYPO|nr:hypothetical protein CDD81_7707 [Ophiocordyceps australis]